MFNVTLLIAAANEERCAVCRGEATTSAAECTCTNRREIDATQMEQAIAELEDVIAHYGMLKSFVHFAGE